MRRRAARSASGRRLSRLSAAIPALAAALSYGIYKTDMPADKTTYVAFVDVGAMDTTVSIVGFVKGKLTVLATASDRQLGGRDFDMLLAKRFAAEWKEKHGIDAYTNKKVSTWRGASQGWEGSSVEGTWGEEARRVSCALHPHQMLPR